VEHSTLSRLVLYAARPSQSRTPGRIETLWRDTNNAELFPQYCTSVLLSHSILELFGDIYLKFLFPLHRKARKFRMTTVVDATAISRNVLHNAEGGLQVVVGRAGLHLGEVNVTIIRVA